MDKDEIMECEDLEVLESRLQEIENGLDNDSSADLWIERKYIEDRIHELTE